MDDMFPEAMCDLTTAQCTILNKLPNLYPRSGKVGNVNHFWLVKVDGRNVSNIDFTAGQFPHLLPYLNYIDGFGYLIGDDNLFKSLGYTIYENVSEERYKVLESAADEIRTCANTLPTGF